MKITGHFENGTVVFDNPPPIAEGSVVEVEAAAFPPITAHALSTGVSKEEWIARLKSWIAKQPVRNIVIDDSRETIYN